MRVERKRGKRVFTPRAIDLHRQALALQPAVDACELVRLRYPEGSRLRYNCDKPVAECECTQQHILRNNLNAELGIAPWDAGDWIRELRDELDRIVAAAG